MRPVDKIFGVDGTADLGRIKDSMAEAPGLLEKRAVAAYRAGPGELHPELPAKHAQFLGVCTTRGVRGQLSPGMGKARKSPPHEAVRLLCTPYAPGDCCEPANNPTPFAFLLDAVPQHLDGGVQEEHAGPRPRQRQRLSGCRRRALQLPLRPRPGERNPAPARTRPLTPANDSEVVLTATLSSRSYSPCECRVLTTQPLVALFKPQGVTRPLEVNEADNAATAAEAEHILEMCAEKEGVGDPTSMAPPTDFDLIVEELIETTQARSGVPLVTRSYCTCSSREHQRFLHLIGQFGSLPSRAVPPACP